MEAARLFKRKDSYSARAKSTTASKPIPLSISSKDFADMDQDASALSSEPIALEESNDKDSEDGKRHSFHSCVFVCAHCLPA